MQRTGRLRRRGRTAAVMTVLLLALAGCGSPTSPSSSSAERFAGTWTGTGQVTRIPSQAPMTFSTATLTLVFAKQNSEITRSGVTLSGTWTMTSADAANNKNGTLRLTAFMGQDCTGGGGGVLLCTNSYTTLGIRDLVLSSSSACSTFYESALSLSSSNTMRVAVHTGSGAVVLDPTCGGSVPNRNYDYLSGDFTLTKQ